MPVELVLIAAPTVAVARELVSQVAIPSVCPSALLHLTAMHFGFFFHQCFRKQEPLPLEKCWGETKMTKGG